jgi:hypothetical protein
MKDEHSTSKEMMRDIQKDGIPMVVLKDGKWVALLPKPTKVRSFELTGIPTVLTTTDT